MAIVSEDVRYTAIDSEMHGRLFRDDRWRSCRPAVMVFPEGFGISEHTYDAAQRITELGYIGLACDVYGEAYFHNGPSAELVERNRRVTSDQRRLRATGISALNLLRARDDVDASRIAAIGYCLGGTIAMELGFAAAPIAAIASFHPSFRGLTLPDAGNTPCPMDLYMGAEDYASPPEARTAFEAAMKGTGVRWRMILYGSVKHSYTNPNCSGMGDAVAYDAEAARHSWESMAALFEEAFAKV
jgi:dienelactone hydrolase